MEPNAATDIIGQAAETAGVPREIIEYFSNNAEAQSEFNQWREEKKKPKPPEAEPVNLTRRKEKIAEEVKDAAKKTYEIRNRSVRTSAWNIRADIKVNLRELNTNEDGEMICQICGDEMPFKVNGQYYFVATQCICNLSKEIPQNHLALCPNCAAKYQHAKNDSDEQVKTAILATAGKRGACQACRCATYHSFHENSSGRFANSFSRVLTLNDYAVTNARFAPFHGLSVVPSPSDHARSTPQTARSSRAASAMCRMQRRASVCGSAAGVALRLRSARRSSPLSAPLSPLADRRPKRLDFHRLISEM